MNKQKQKKPFIVYIFLFFIFFQAISGLLGGIVLIFDPSGELLQMPVSLLDGSPFKNFFLPGLILFTLLGIYPALIFYALIARPRWELFNFFNIYKDQHWSWTGSLYVGIMLIICIDFQIMIIGYGHIIQTIYALLGVVIVVLTLLPSIKNYYS